MTIERIFVQVTDDRHWTLEAAHLACQVARLTNAEIVFVKMVPVQYANWLGTDFGYLSLTGEDRTALREYAATAEDYGVECSAQIFQYVSFVEGLSQAAELFQTQLVFATPVVPIPLLKTFQRWSLRRILIHHAQQLADSELVSALLSSDDCDSYKLPVFASVEH